MTPGQKKAVIAGVLLLAIVIVLWFWSTIASKWASISMSEVQLPVLIIAGVLTLLLALAITSVSFALLDLSDKSEALALPKGSVRAVIALALVVIFAIISIYLYSTLVAGNGELKRLEGVSEAIVAALQEEAARPGSGVEIIEVSPFPGATTQGTGTPGGTTPTATTPGSTTPGGSTPGGTTPGGTTPGGTTPGGTTPGLFTVVYRSGVNRDAAEFAKQLFILIGTLVTSVASFYFGSQSVAAAQTAGGPVASALAITSVSPSSISRSTNPGQLTILGSSLLPLKEVRLVQGTTKVAATVLSSNSGAIVCNINPTTFQSGAAEIEVESSGGTARSPVTLT